MQKVFITGAANGIGLALAKAYARQNVVLGLTVRKKDHLDKLAHIFPHAHVEIYLVDINDAVQLNDAAQRFIRKQGCPDIVIACAGISQGGEISLDDAKNIMSTNFFGTMACFLAFIPEMKRQKKGTLVGISSLASFRGMPGSAVYSASKAAVNQYLEALRIELKPAQISVLNLVPGFVKTQITANNDFYMPYLISAEQFATKAVRCIARRRIFTIIPWPMYFFAKLLQWLPRGLFDVIFSKTPHKS